MCSVPAAQVKTGQDPSMQTFVQDRTGLSRLYELCPATRIFEPGSVAEIVPDSSLGASKIL